MNKIIYKLFKRRSDYESVNKVLSEKLSDACAKICELEQKLETSRKLYSIEHDRADKAIEGATLMADQNAFLRETIMRMIQNGKEAPKNDHDST